MDKTPAMECIRGARIKDVLDREYRQYLTGHLARPQPELQHIEDDIEIGMSYYQTFTADTPHVHPRATEHGYVLEGCLRIRLLDGSGTEMEFHEGDFFVIRPGTPYAGKNKEGTRILFIKSPGVNDKTPVEPDGETRAWLRSWDL